MLTVPAPQAFNGETLCQSLAAQGLVVTPEDLFVDAEGLHLAPLDESHRATVEAAIASHDPGPSASARNADTLRQRAQQALVANATYLAVASPSNAQNLAQIRTLTRECNALIRLVLGLVDDITGTA